MNEDLELRDLRYFRAIVEEGQLTRAAERLHVSQPTLSHAVSRLEEACGGPLWLRRANRRAGVVPTERGRLLLVRTARVLGELTGLADDFARLDGLQTGRVRVGAVQTLAASMMAGLVARFAREHPGVELELYTVSSESAPEDLKDARVDVALVAGPAPEDPDVRTRGCFRQRFVAVCRRDDPLACGKSVPLPALRDRELVLVPPDTFTSQTVHDACGQAGFEPRVRYRLASVTGLCALVREGVGITLLPEGAVPEGDPLLMELPLSRPAVRRPVHVAWLAGAESSAALAKLVEMAQKWR
jgi:LysR family cyn operon transcriptional activator